jgi:hypothetical protein
MFGTCPNMDSKFVEFVDARKGCASEDMASYRPSDVCVRSTACFRSVATVGSFRHIVLSKLEGFETGGA